MKRETMSDKRFKSAIDGMSIAGIRASLQKIREAKRNNERILLGLSVTPCGMSAERIAYMILRGQHMKRRNKP
jgi:hypothetical protein